MTVDNEGYSGDIRVITNGPELRRAYMKGDLLLERIGLPSSVQEKQATRHVSYHRVHQSRGHRAMRADRVCGASSRNAPVATDTGIAECGYRNPDLPAQEPGPVRNRRGL